jgi:hypothetical protein
VRSELAAWRASAERFVRVKTQEHARAWIDEAARLCHPQISWDLTEFGPPPGIPLVLYGIESVTDFWRSWFHQWVPLRREFELVDAGDSIVMLVDLECFEDRSSGELVTIGRYAQRATFADGLMASWKAYLSQAEALNVAFAA